MSSFLNSRIRRLPSQNDQHNQHRHYFSVASARLPPGTLLVHELRNQEINATDIDNREEIHHPCLHRVFLLNNMSIVDHGWTVGQPEGSGQSSTFNLYLATLTRSHERTRDCIDLNNPNHSIESHVDIYCILNTVLHDCDSSTKDQQSPKIVPCFTFSVPSFATSLSVDCNFIAVSTSSGVVVYDMDGFVQVDGANPDLYCRTLLPYHTVHACGLAYPYIAVASNDRMGVWDLNTLFSREDRTQAHGSRGGKIPPCTWSSSIRECDSRLTSILFLGSNHEYLALSCWKGSVYVFHNNKDDCRWKQVWHLPSTEKLVETAVYPTFLGSIKRARSNRAFLVVSTPGTGVLRVFDLQSFKEIKTSNHLPTTGTSVHGLITVSDIAVWIDENMYLHEERVDLLK